jgi:hypothetical protein
MFLNPDNGHQLAILDGTLVRIDRLGGDLNRLYYSGKHHHHGVNLQGLVDPRRGDLVWISDGLPGSTHDLTAARIHDLIRHAAREVAAMLGVPVKRVWTVRRRHGYVAARRGRPPGLAPDATQPCLECHGYFRGLGTTPGPQARPYPAGGTAGALLRSGAPQRRRPATQASGASAVYGLSLSRQPWQS